MIDSPDPRTAATVTAMSLDLAELLATIDEVRARLQHVHAQLTCAQLDAAEHRMPLD